MKICSVVGCPNPTKGRASRCPGHAPSPWAGAEARKAARRAELSDRQWRALRVEVLKRDGWKCDLCGDPATEVDHIVPFTEGGRSTPSNLRAICRPCHASKSAREGNRARRKNRQ